MKQGFVKVAAATPNIKVEMWITTSRKSVD